MNENLKKLQWKTIHATDFNNENDFLETILLDNGVDEENIKAFLHPTRKYVNDPLLMTNMAEAVSLVHKHLENNSKIFVKVDPDVDGFTSSSTLIQFLQTINPEIIVDYALSYEKRHGLTYEDLAKHRKDEYGLIIIPDASMTVRDARMIKNNFTADILVLDHHLVEKEYLEKATNNWINREEAKQLYTQDKNNIEIDCYTKYCLAVNDTDGNYPNPTLSGAGVVQKFIEAYIDTYSLEDGLDEDIKYRWLDLVSLGISADSMDLRNLESRYYVLEGMKQQNCNNEFINELVERNAEDMKWGRYVVSMTWQIAPKINGVIRYGKDEEQLDTFRAMLGIQEDREYQPRRKHKEDPLPPKEIHSLQKTMARVCENVKSRQDTEVRKFVTELEKTIEAEGLDKNSVIFIDGTKILERGTVTGLVANKLTGKYFRPVVLMRSKNSTEFGGSMRGYDKSNITDTKAFLEAAGIQVNGHKQAAGIVFSKNKLDEIIANCNKIMPVDQLTTIHTVDWELPASKLKREYVQQVAENYAVWCSTVPEPTFAITDLNINASQIAAYGETQAFIRFVYNGITFVKKYCARDDFEIMTQKGRQGFGSNKKNLKLDIIGQFVLNKFEDKIIPEVKILYFNSEEVKKTDTGKDDDFETEVVTKPKATKKATDDFDW